MVEPRAYRLACAAVVLWLCAAARAGELTVERGEHTVLIQRGGQPVLEYRFTPNPFKPCVSRLYTPKGVQVLRDSPADHKHHHALMFALTAEGVDFWGEQPADRVGRQVSQDCHAGRPTEENGVTRLGVNQRLEWQSPTGRPLLREHRTLALHEAPDLGATLLTWDTRCSAAEGRSVAVLAGAHYVGLGMRLVQAMDKAGRFLTPGGKLGEVVRGTERLTPGTWCAYAAQADGKPVTVAMFAHPDNDRGTAWFTMTAPFAYLSATVRLHEEPLVILEAEDLWLTYGVALWDGAVGAEAIEALYKRWCPIARFPVADRAPADGYVNVALARHGTKALASSEYGPDYRAANAIDGQWTIREKHKWNTAANITPHFLRLDFGQPRTIERIAIRHEGVYADGEQHNTADFRLQRSERPWGPWLDIVPPVYDNTKDITLHRVHPPVTTRYLRLLIETGEQHGRNAYARIYELEAYAPRATLKE